MQWEDITGSAIAEGISTHSLDPSRQFLLSEYTSTVTHNTTSPDFYIFRTKHYFLDAAMAHTTGMVSECDLSATVYNHVLIIGLVPEALNQRALLHMVQETCKQPHALCQQCLTHRSETKSSGQMLTHIVVIEGTMILAIE